MMPFDKNKVEEILELARLGYGTNEIARRAHTTPPTVKKYCDRAGIQRRPAVLAKWTDSMIDEAVRLYEAGNSARQVSKMMGHGWRQTQKYLDERGVEKRGQGLKGERNYFWNNGTIYDKHGYVLVYAPNHPYRNHQNKVREHRLVMEQKLGRYLRPEEVVDHMNGVTNDNRPDNLRLFSSNAEHLAATLKGRVPKWSEEGYARLLASGKAYRLQRKFGRSILYVQQLLQYRVHHCAAGTCPLYETWLERRRKQQRSRLRAWRKRERERRLHSAQAQS